jgi:hypothetical protein
VDDHQSNDSSTSAADKPANGAFDPERTSSLADPSRFEELGDGPANQRN